MPTDGGAADMASSGSSSTDLGGDGGSLSSSAGASSAGGDAMGAVAGDDAISGAAGLPHGGSSGTGESGGKLGSSGGGAAGHAGAGGAAATGGSGGAAGHAGAVGLGGTTGQSGAAAGGAPAGGAPAGGAPAGGAPAGGAPAGGAPAGGAPAGGAPGGPLCSDHAITATSTWVPSVSSHSSGSSASNLTDNSITRWTSGKPQAGDEWLQIDFGAVVNIRRINLQQGSDSANDYPRSYAVYVSNAALDSSGTARATGSGTSGVTTTILLPSVASGRYLYIKQLSTSLSWWSVEELEVTCSDN